MAAKKSDDTLMWAGAGLAVVVLYSVVTKSGGAGGSAEKLSYLGREDLPRGMRNNNPGNIERNASNQWLGKIQGSDPRFESFSTFAFGTRALIKLLKNYIDRGNNTVAKIIARWAPASVDNNPTASYASKVAERSGLGLHTPLQPDKDTLRRLTQAIADFENGRSGVVPDEVFEVAYSLL